MEKIMDMKSQSPMINNATQACKFSMLNIMSKSIGEDEVGWCFCSFHDKPQLINIQIQYDKAMHGQVILVANFLNPC